MLYLLDFVHYTVLKYTYLNKEKLQKLRIAVLKIKTNNSMTHRRS